MITFQKKNVRSNHNGEYFPFGFTYGCINLHLEMVENALRREIADPLQHWGKQPPGNKAGMRTFIKYWINQPWDYPTLGLLQIYCLSHYKFYFYIIYSNDVKYTQCTMYIFTHWFISSSKHSGNCSQNIFWLPAWRMLCISSFQV